MKITLLTAGLLLPIRVLEPVQQLVLMTAGIAPEVALADASPDSS